MKLCVNLNDYLANVRPGSSVRLHMSVDVRRIQETFATCRAREVLFVLVCFNVSFQPGAFAEAFAAYFTYVRLFSGMYSLMNLIINL